VPSVYLGLAPRLHRHHSGAIPSDQSCPGNQLVDAITLNCVSPCPDDSRPVNGQCVGYSGAAVGPGYMIIGGKAIPKWALYVAGGMAVTLLILFVWHPGAGHKVMAKAASFLR
jgi:hypothetical protein